MRSLQLQIRNTDNRIIRKESSCQRRNAQSRTFFHGYFANDGIHVSAFVEQRVQTDTDVPDCHMGSVKTFCRTGFSGIITGRGTRQKKLPQPIELVL